MNASLFVLLFVLLLFFRFSLCFFFWGGAGGWGWICFLGVGAGIQCNATLTQSIALRSAIVGRENLIAGGLFVLFCLFFLLFCVFLIYFYYFFGGGGRFSFFGGGGRGIDYPNYAPRTVSQKILAQFLFWFVLLYVVV